LAPAKVAKVISDTERKVVTAIVDEDQLSLAIGRNGQNVRLASQLIGWQIDLYSSREWMERGAESTLFRDSEEYEGAADFSLKELEISPAILAALSEAGYKTFMNIIDLERDDLLRVSGLGPEEVDVLTKLIEELTIVEEPAELSSEAPPGAEPAATGEPTVPDDGSEEDVEGVTVLAEMETVTAATEEAATEEAATEEAEPAEATEELSGDAADDIEGEVAEGDIEEAVAAEAEVVAEGDAEKRDA